VASKGPRPKQTSLPVDGDGRQFTLRSALVVLIAAAVLTGLLVTHRLGLLAFFAGVGSVVLALRTPRNTSAPIVVAMVYVSALALPFLAGPLVDFLRSVGLRESHERDIFLSFVSGPIAGLGGTLVTLGGCWATRGRNPTAWLGAGAMVVLGMVAWN